MAKTGVQAVSVILMLIAAITAGAAVADILYTTITICPATTGVCPTASSAVLLTYIASGVWASIFVFVCCIFGIGYTSCPECARPKFCVLGFLTSIVFVPAMIVINALGAYMVMSVTPGATTTTSLWNPSTPNDGYMIKFILPAAVAVLGLVQFFFLSGLLLYICSQKLPKKMKDVDDEKPAASDPQPTPPPQNVPGYGYYYPSKIYEFPTPARTAGYPAAPGGYNGRYYY